MTVEVFLKQAGWADASQIALAGDASRRRYLRLVRAEGATAILMIAPPGPTSKLPEFRRIAGYLSGLGLTTPAEYAVDEPHGLLLMEDFGDGLIARLAALDPGSETRLYEAAVDVLVRLHRETPPADLPDYGGAAMVPYALSALSVYRNGIDVPLQAGEEQALHAALSAALERLAPERSAVVLRDYHAENLLSLPAQDGVVRLGLLDFQDAARGHAAYDLASLLKDARRDLSEGLEERMILHYLARTDTPPERFRAAYAALAAQRNLRLVLQFPRLALQDGKPAYLSLLPRVWAHLMAALAHEALNDLRRAVERHVPEPTPEILAKLEARAT